MRRSFRPSLEPLDRRELPASHWLGVAWGLYAVYTSPPIAVVRKIAFGGKIGKLAWTGQAKFAFGLVKLSHPYPLRRVIVRIDRPKALLRLASRRARLANAASRISDAGK